MKRITFGMTLTLFAITSGCSDEADIGGTSEPVACMDSAQGEVSGTVVAPYNGERFDFGAAEVTMSVTDTPSQPLVTLSDEALRLRLGFRCGSDVGDYDIVHQDDIPEACSFAVTGTIVGQIEILFAESGQLIVDESEECLAGRFSADFGESADFGDLGDLSGWFSVPWPAN